MVALTRTCSGARSLRVALRPLLGRLAVPVRGLERAFRAAVRRAHRRSRCAHADARARAARHTQRDPRLHTRRQGAVLFIVSVVQYCINTVSVYL